MIENAATSTLDSDIEEQSWWPEMQCLVSFALALSFDGRLDGNIVVAELCHMF